MYINKSVKIYLNHLASKSPAPGGGSAAALVGALASGLVCMVSRFSGSLGKDKEIKKVLKEACFLSGKLVKLIDEDVNAYNKVVNAAKKPRRTPVQKRKRKIALDSALKTALKTSKQISELCRQGLNLTKKLTEIGNKNLVSDIAISVILFEAAYRSAAYNVRVNLKSLKDKNLINKEEINFSSLNKKIDKIKKEALKEVERFL